MPRQGTGPFTSVVLSNNSIKNGISHIRDTKRRIMARPCNLG